MSTPVVIVTGASSGIGAEVARRLVACGRRVALVARTRANLERLVAEVGEDYALAVTADLHDPAAADAILAATLERFGRLDALVNNAGLAALRFIPDTDDRLLEDVFGVNVFAPARLIARAWPHLQERGGVVVNVSSMAAADPFPGFFLYAAAKAAVESFTRSVAGEGEADGIRAWSVAPGAVETPMLRSLFDEATLGPDRTLAPDDVAAVIVACITGDRPEPSGAVISVPSP